MTSEKVILYGAEYCPLCLLAKKYLDSNNITYDYIDISSNPEEFVEKTGERKIPVLLIGEKKIVGFEQSSYNIVFS